MRWPGWGQNGEKERKEGESSEKKDKRKKHCIKIENEGNLSNAIKKQELNELQ